MFGIGGLLLKESLLEAGRGPLLTDMLATMKNRGPDSAGITGYGDNTGSVRLNVQFPVADRNFAILAEDLGKPVGAAITLPRKDSHSKTLVYRSCPSRFGMSADDIHHADAIELAVGQGAKPGGGMVIGQKIWDRDVKMRNFAKGIHQRSACRQSDSAGADDLEIRACGITGLEKPIYTKIRGERPYCGKTLAVETGADVVVIDG